MFSNSIFSAYDDDENYLLFQYLAGFHWLDKDEAVTVETLPSNIVSQLPAMEATKKH